MPQQWPILLTVLLVFPLLQAQETHNHPAPEKLGKVSFPISCKPAVQEQFNRGVALASLLRLCRRREWHFSVWPNRIRSVRWRIGESP